MLIVGEQGLISLETGQGCTQTLKDFEEIVKVLLKRSTEDENNANASPYGTEYSRRSICANVKSRAIAFKSSHERL